MNWLDIFRSLGTGALIVVVMLIGRDINRRLNRVEDQIGTLAKVVSRGPRMLPDDSNVDTDEEPFI